MKEWTIEARPHNAKEDWEVVVSFYIEAEDQYAAQKIFDERYRHIFGVDGYILNQFQGGCLGV